MFKKIGLLLICLTFFGIGSASADSTVRYRATFTSTWSQATHPHSSGSLPSSAHWSVLVGGTHSDAVSFWDVGQFASTGIKDMAERGANAQLRSEISAAIGMGSADAVHEDDEILWDASGTLVMEFDVSSAFDRVTLVTMIAPSPDWFTGVSGQPLRDEEGNWLDEVVVDLYPYDAGTDSGTDYRSPNAPTNPAQPIANGQGAAPFSNEPLGTLTFTRLTLPMSVTISQSSANTVPPLALLWVSLLLYALTAWLFWRARPMTL